MSRRVTAYACPNYDFSIGYSRLVSVRERRGILSIASESPLFMLILIVIEIGPKIDSWVGWPRELRLELPVPLPDDPERRRPNKAHRADCRGSRYQ